MAKHARVASSSSGAGDLLNDLDGHGDDERVVEEAHDAVCEDKPPHPHGGHGGVGCRERSADREREVQEVSQAGMGGARKFERGMLGVAVLQRFVDLGEAGVEKVPGQDDSDRGGHSEEYRFPSRFASLSNPTA